MTTKKAADSAHKGRSKAAKKKTDGKRRLSVRQNKLLQGIVGGKKSPRQVALDAGYSARSADHPGELLNTAKMREALGMLIAPIEKIAQRINEGLDAKKTEFAKFEGRISDSVDCIDFEQRRQYAALAAKLKGLDPGIKVEHEGDVTQRVIVEFVDVAALQEP